MYYLFHIYTSFHTIHHRLVLDRSDTESTRRVSIETHIPIVRKPRDQFSRDWFGGLSSPFLHVGPDVNLPGEARPVLRVQTPICLGDLQHIST